MIAIPRAPFLGLAGAAALVPLSSTMIAVALSDLERDLDASLGAAAIWLVSGYLVVAALAQPAGGRLGDVLGHRRAFLGGLIVFMAASALAAAAPSFPALVAARGVQAAAGAVMVPSAVALLRELTPPDRRGRTFGWFGSAMGLGATVGPLVGGGMVAALGWRGIFLVNLPLGVAALAATARARPLAAAPVGGRPAPGAPSALRHARALVRQGAFVAASATILLHNLVLYALLLLVPLMAERRLDLSAGEAGLLLAAMTAPMLGASPLGGLLSDRLGRRAPALAGAVLGLAATLILLRLMPEPPVAALAALLALVGFGIGLAGASPQTTAVESAPRGAVGLAGGLYTTSRYAGGIAGAGLVAALGPREAFTAALAVLAAVAATGVASCARLPGRRGPAGVPRGARPAD